MNLSSIRHKAAQRLPVPGKDVEALLFEMDALRLENVLLTMALEQPLASSEKGKGNE